MLNNIVTLKCGFRGHLRSFKLVPFESLGAFSYSLSIVTMAISFIICEIKRHIGRKSWFSHTPLHSTPSLGGGGVPSEYFHPVWCVKHVEWWGYPMVKNFEDIHNRLDTIPACDRQTDRQTDILPRHSQRYAYASRGKNVTKIWFDRLLIGSIRGSWWLALTKKLSCRGVMMLHAVEHFAKPPKVFRNDTFE